MIRPRTQIAALALSASALVALVLNEGYTDHAVIPIPGDVATLGFGTTEGVRMGDTITPPKALARALRDVQTFEGAVKKCVKVTLHQHEYDAYIQFSYNVGSSAFCGSTLVKKLNAGDYKGSCAELLRWNRAGGRVVRGLTIRRQAEYKTCMGETA